MPDSRALRLAVLIDADNVPATHAERIFGEVTRYGEAGLRRVYGDWSNAHLTGWAGEARKLGLVQHQQAANTTGKNASDIALVIDAMDILHAGHFDGFVLVSSDSDFTRLASRIREQGRAVIGIGENKAPESFKNACTRFVSISNIGTDADAATPAKGETDSDLSPGQMQKARSQVIRAMNKIDAEAEWFHLGQLGQQLLSDQPDFDTRTYGFAKLSDLLRKLKGFQLKPQSGKQNMMVRRTSK